MNFFAFFSQIFSLKSEIGFLREKVKEKSNAMRTLLRRSSSVYKISSPCESPKLDKISEKNNEECRDTCISITLNPIQSNNNCQSTKLPKQKSRVNDIQIDSVVQAHPDETTHMTEVTSSTKVTSSNVNEMSHVMNKENRPPDKEKDKPPPPSQNPTKHQKSVKYQCLSLGIA